MPELPEVETVRRALEQEVLGRRIEQVAARDVMMRRPVDAGRLREALPGRRLTSFRRRGKFLLADLDRGGSLLVHLGMSGRLRLTSPGEEVPPHTHVRAMLDDGRELRLVDPRRFGLVVLLEPGEEELDPSLQRLGIEPLVPELPAVLPDLLGGRRAPVKALLLDQRLVAGVGNIYATEALWRAGVRPSRSPGRTASRRLERIAIELQQVLREAIDAGGTTLRDFSSPAGDIGYFAVRLAVYGREGTPCTRCATPLRSSLIAGRSGAWCPACQR